MKRIVIDPGHGGTDPGAVSHKIKEKRITLEASKMLKTYLSKMFHVKLTRTQDEYIRLAKRAQIANEYGADAFISMHCNASKNKLARGFDTFYFNNSKNGLALSSSIYDSVIANSDLTPRGVKPRNFVVLRRTAMPAALVELGFITNVRNREMLTDKDALSNLVYHVSKGIQDYFTGAE